MQFSLEQLTALVAVYELGSFSKAAVFLSRHRTTTGQVITSLEEQLAVELFERVGRSTRPTEAGQLLYRYAKSTVEQAKAFDKMALSLADDGLEKITVAYCSFMPNDLLVRIRRRLRAAFPTMRVDFTIKPKEVVRQGILNNEIQVGIVNIDSRSPITSFDGTFLTHITFAIYASKNSDLAQYSSSQLLGQIRTHKQLVLRTCLEDGFSEKMIASPDFEVVDDISLLIGMLADGIGWAMIPKFIVDSWAGKDQLKKLEFDELLDDFRFPVALWAPHSKTLRPIKHAITQEIETYISEHNRQHKG